jgi:hypothetical protein
MGIAGIVRFKFLALVTFSVVVMSVGFGFAAQNTVDESSAGDGWAEISGYNVTNVQYTLNNTNPQNLDNVKFNISGGHGKPGTVKAKLVQNSSTWFDCTSSSTSAPYAYTCTTTGVSVQNANELRVIAAQ